MKRTAMKNVLGALLAIACNSALANLVTDPSFELGGVGWTFIDNAGLDSSFGAHTGAWAAYVNAPIHGVSGSVNQTISTTPTHTYLVKFWLASNCWAAGDLSVSFGDTVGFAQTDLPPCSPWTEYSFTAIATSQNSVFQLAGRNLDGTYEIDDISIVDLTAAIATSADWKFEEGSGVGFIDSYSNGVRNNGVLINGASYVLSAHSSASQYSVSFDGSDDIAAIPDSPTLRPARITVEAWIKPQSGARVVVGKQFGSDCCVNSYQIELNPFRFQLTDATGQDHHITAPRNPAANRWHHVAGTWNGTTMKLYLNKRLVASGAFTGAIGYDRNPVLIGGDDDGSGVPGNALFKGLIDQVRITRKALTAAGFLP